MQGSPVLKQCLHGGNVMQHFRQIIEFSFRKALDFREEVFDFGSAGNQAMRTLFFLFRALIRLLVFFPLETMLRLLELTLGVSQSDGRLFFLFPLQQPPS